MKIKLDENLPEELVDLLTARGHDTDTVRSEQLVGRDDPTIFGAACAAGRMLFTQDMDFSDVRQFAPGTHPGLVLIRLHNPSRRQIIQRIEQVLKSSDPADWAKCFVVIADRKLRIRRPQR